MVTQPAGTPAANARASIADLRVDRWPAGPGVGVGPVPGEQLTVPAEQGGRGDEERRPAGPGQQPGQGGQHHAVVRAQLGPVHLAPQDPDLVAQDQQFDVLGAAVAGELGQHLQDLPDEQVHQRGAHGRILAIA